MSDEVLRGFERRWKETGNADDELVWDRERARVRLPQRVTVLALSIRTFEPHLEDSSVFQAHPGKQQWEAALLAASSGVARPWVALDLSRVHYIQSSLIAEIARAHDRLRKLGGGVALCGTPPNVLVVFGMLGLLDEVFEFHESVESCLRERRWERRGEVVVVERMLKT